MASVFVENRFYGRGCTCTDLICPFTKKGQCTCECGKCKCNTGFKGIDCTEMKCDNPIKRNKCKQSVGSPTCSNKGKCHCGRCSCPHQFKGTFCEMKTVWVRCSEVNKCMMNVFDTKKTSACTIPIIMVKTLYDSPCELLLIQAYFIHTCQMIHHNCVRSFMIHINQQGTGIYRISLKIMEQQNDCAQDSNQTFKKRLIKFCVVTSAFAIVFYSITITCHYYYIKWRNKRDMKNRMLLQWIIKNRGQYEEPLQPVVENPNND
ncbi:Integrin beta-7 [Thelohanellus kitauei]|uniref:Integrin beta-7 n=1 Tax=Thelohanellus kitauei TaxID=669202 RepID=A0A0C2MHK1_THEKT|nr:Integrin beta-7 [Thelohanellus kitauei]